MERIGKVRGKRSGRSEVRGQIAEVKIKVGFYLCNLTSNL